MQIHNGPVGMGEVGRGRGVGSGEEDGDDRLLTACAMQVSWCIQWLELAVSVVAGPEQGWVIYQGAMITVWSVLIYCTRKLLRREQLSGLEDREQKIWKGSLSFILESILNSWRGLKTWSIIFITAILMQVPAIMCSSFWRNAVGKQCRLGTRYQTAPLCNLMCCNQETKMRENFGKNFYDKHAAPSCRDLLHAYVYVPHNPPNVNICMKQTLVWRKPGLAVPVFSNSPPSCTGYYHTHFLKLDTGAIYQVTPLPIMCMNR